MKTKSTLTLALMLFSAAAVLATNHVITFPNGGFTYSPATLSVSVGDTVTWQGPFSNHPLSTTSVPAGAATITGNNTGTVYVYPVLVAGTYNYKCDQHNGFGMNGTFTATAVTTNIEAPSTGLPQLKFDNRGSVVKLSDESETAHGSYSVRIGNILGETVWKGTMSPNDHELVISIDNQPKGVYVIAVADEQRNTFIRKFLCQ